jgi:hypothetical protein
MKIRSSISRSVPSLAILLLAPVCVPAIWGQAQKTTTPPPTDTAAQSSPVQPAPKVPAVDAAAQSSPIPEPHTGGVWLSPKTAIRIALTQAVDSASLHNGQTVPAKLTAALTAHGKTLPAGTPAELTVVATVPVGKLYAVGELSLQLVSVGGVPVYTDTQTFRGTPGPRLTADAVPAKGTEASLPQAAALTFHVLSPPTPATAPPPNVPNPPGSVSSKVH